MFKRFMLKIAIKNIIKNMPKFKIQAKEIVENNIDGFLDRVEQDIEALLLNIIAKKENK